MINGDDILFQSSERFARHWMSTVADLGLEVEESKTSVSDVFGTLNSTLFEWVGDALCVSPTPRLGMLRPVDFSVALGANFRSFVSGFRLEQRFRAAKVFFRCHLYRLRESRLSLDELGFRGSLAFRVARLFGLLPKDLAFYASPALPCPHNVRLPSGGAVVAVEEGTLGPELTELNAREMASWKWSHEYDQVQSVLQYCIQLSFVRRPLGIGTWFHHIPMSVPSGSSLKRRFCRPLFEGPKTVLVFSQVLASQDLDLYDRLPSYEDAVVESLVRPEKEW
jgi:hypothetical protein